MTAGLVLVVLVLAARYSRPWGAIGGYLLVVAGLLWLLVDKTMEGRVLVVLLPEHGLTEGDLAGVLAILLGLHQARYDLLATAKRLMMLGWGRRARRSGSDRS